MNGFATFARRLIAGIATLGSTALALAASAPPADRAPLVSVDPRSSDRGPREGMNTGVCCRLGPICEFTDPEVPANRCDDPTAGTCSVSGGPCSADADCVPGVCTDTGLNCSAVWVCPVGETCTAGVCGSGGTIACSTDGDCPGGTQCIGAERCILGDCPEMICSDSSNGAVTSCTSNGDCGAGLCTDGSTPCHDNYDCAPGGCGIPFFGMPCFDDADCPSPASNCSVPAPDTCVGGATCDPQRCVDVPLCDVTDQPTCEIDLGGNFSTASAECDPAGTPDFQNVCFAGACCTDDQVGGKCKDSTVEPDACPGALTCGDFGPEGCESWEGGSVFIPGATCAADPCPMCAFEDEDHCQLYDPQITFISRCDAFPGQDFRCADDFRAAESGVLDRVCWWPAFAPPSYLGLPECYEPGVAPADNFTLHVYEDLGNIPDEGNEVTPPGGLPLHVDMTVPVLGRIWQYSAAVGDPGDPPVQLVAGECYWLEIHGVGTEECNIFWGRSSKGNNHAMQDFNLPDYPNYTSEDTANLDLAWCLSLAIEQTPPSEAGCDAEVLGACCLCPEEGTEDPPTCVLNTIDECGTLPDPNGGVGHWKILYKCANSDTVCRFDINGDDDCPPGEGPCVADTAPCDPSPCTGFPENDHCVDAITITHEDCDPTITTYYDLRCSDNEGPATNCAIGGGDLSFGLWYRYVAPTCGTVLVETCNSTPVFDGFGAIYRVYDFMPGNECADIPATPNSDAACNDDGCGAGGPWAFVLNVIEDEELLLRVGAWWDGDPANISRARGYGFFELTFFPFDEFDPFNPHCSAPAGPVLPAPYPHDSAKNRYVSFDPNKAESGGTDIGFQIELKSLAQGSCSGVDSAPCRYVQGAGENEPGDADCRRCSGDGHPCISSAVDCSPSTQSCEPSGETCQNDAPAAGGSNVGQVFWVGPEDSAAPGRFLAVTEAFREVRRGLDWPDVIHLGDCEIVPQATYGVRAVPIYSDGCVWYKAPEVIFSTTPRPANGNFAWWGDGVGELTGFCNNGDIRAAACTPGDTGACAGNPAECKLAWTPPNGYTNFDDVNAALALFAATGGAPTAPLPAGVPLNPELPDITWVDLHGDDAGSAMVDPPQGVASFSDVQQILLAFQGRPYPYADPADCPDVATWP